MEGFNNAQSEHKPQTQQQQNAQPAHHTTPVNPTATTNTVNPAVKYNFQGMPGCVKCNGTGFKISKKKDGKQKLCSACVKAKGFCPKCNGTGVRADKGGKACKCKEKAEKKSSKDKEHKKK